MDGPGDQGGARGGGGGGDGARPWVTAVVFAAALVPRLLVASALAGEPVWDAHYYHLGALRIAGGHGYSDDVLVDGVLRWHPWCHYPVGYSGLLALVYRLVGPSLLAGPVANAVLGAALAALVYRVTALVGGHRRGLVASALVALSPELLVYTALLMTEPAASLAPLGAALAAALGQRRGRPLAGAVAAGAVLGLGALVRPQTLLGAPALALLAWSWPAAGAPAGRAAAAARGAVGRALAVGAVATAAALAVVLPWTARNCRVMDRCTLVSSNAGWNLAIGSFPRATGRFETLRATDGCPVVTGQVQQDSCWRDLGLFYIRTDTRRWLGLIPTKLGQTYDHSSFAAGYLAEAHPRLLEGDRRERLRRALTASHRALLALGAFVVVGAPWRRRGAGRAAQGALLAALVGLVGWLAGHDEPAPWWWLAALTPLLACLPLPGAPRHGGVVRYLLATYALVSVTHAVFFGEDRYHIVVTPILAVLAALALRAPGPEGARADG